MAFTSSLGKAPGSASSRSAKTGAYYSSPSARKQATEIRRETGIEPTPEQLGAVPEATTPATTEPSRYEQASYAAQYYAERGEGKQAQRARTRALFLAGSPTQTTKYSAYMEMPMGELQLQRAEREPLRAKRTPLTLLAGKQLEQERYTLAAGAIEQAIYGKPTKEIQFTSEKGYTSFAGLTAGYEKAFETTEKKEQERLAKREKVTRSEEIKQRTFGLRKTQEKIFAKDSTLKERFQAAGGSFVESGKLALLGAREAFAPGAFTPKDKEGKPMMIETIGAGKLPLTLQQTLYARDKKLFRKETFPNLQQSKFTAKAGEITKYDKAFLEQSGFTRPEAEKITVRAGSVVAGGVIALGTFGAVAPAYIGTKATTIASSSVVGATILGSRTYRSIKTGTPLSAELQIGAVEILGFEVITRGPGLVKTYSPFKYTKISHPTAKGGTRAYRGVSVGERTIVGTYRGKLVLGSPAKKLVSGIAREGPGVTGEFFRLETPAKARIAKQMQQQLGDTLATARQEKIIGITKQLRKVKQTPAEIGMLGRETKTSTPAEMKIFRSWQKKMRGSGFGSDPQSAQVGAKRFREKRARFIDEPAKNLGPSDKDLSVLFGEARTRGKIKKGLLPKLRATQKGTGRESILGKEGTTIELKEAGKKTRTQYDIKTPESEEIAPETFVGIKIEQKPIKMLGETEKGTQFLKEAPLRQQLLAKAEASTQVRIEKGKIEFGPPAEKYKNVPDWFSAAEGLSESKGFRSPKKVGIQKEISKTESLYSKQKGSATEVVEIPYSVAKSRSPSFKAVSASPLVSPSVSKSFSKGISKSISPSKSLSKSISPSRSISPSVSRSPSPSPSVSYSRSISPSLSKSPSYSISPSPSPSRSISKGGFGFPGKLPFSDIPRESYGKVSKSVKGKRKYTPSVEALFFDIKGKKPSKFALRTGLVLRPIIK